MDTYEVQFKENETEGVYAISLVDSPAMESQFIALKKQEKVQLKVIDEEKMLLLGAVLIPNKLIFRKQDGKEFNIVFPTKTVRLAMENFLIKGYQKKNVACRNLERYRHPCRRPALFYAIGYFIYVFKRKFKKL